MPNRKLSIGCALVFGALTSCGGAVDHAGDGSGVVGPPDLDHCANLADEKAPAVTVLIENRTSVPIYVGPPQQTCYNLSVLAPFSVNGGLAISARGCGDVSCAALAKGGPGSTFTCSSICIDSTYFTRLLVGETLKTSWWAASLSLYELPTKCLGDQENSLTRCTRAERAPLGTMLTFETQAGTELDCSSATGGVCGSCLSDPSGGCVVQGKMVAGTLLHATSTIELADSNVVELTFFD
jgi:hypothetical protein